LRERGEMADWDADDFEPEVDLAKAVKVSDKWEGEDEDDDVKDAWDASSEDENSQKDENKSTAPTVQRKKKKNLADKIAEKENAKHKDLEDLAAAEEMERLKNTPEAIAAEKLRIKMKEEQDAIEAAKELCGLKDTAVAEGTIDAMSPVTKEEFDDFQQALSEKISGYSESEHYPDCVVELIKNICINLNTITLKKIKNDVEAFHSAKLKEEKAAKAGKKPKPKANLKMDLDRDLYGGGAIDYGNDMDDFM